jgi:predicted AAA+ superfamily ATPase
MQKDRLKEIMLDQKEVFNHQKHLIDRDIDYERYILTGQVVIVSGIRRCGKSSLLYLFRERMKLDDARYCYFNFDDERIIRETGVLEQVYHLHLELYGTEPVMFLDEVQNIDGWEKFINRMYERGIKVFVTGSNARLLSSEISTSLTGRNLVLALFPFSFSEYLRYTGSSYDPERLSATRKALLIKDFNQYMATGGFPLLVKEQDLELIHSYFQDILYRDIVSRYRLSQVDELRQIGLYFASNIGKLFSYSTLQAISGVKSPSSIKEYLEYYRQSWLFFYLKKFDYSVSKQIMNPKKVYAVDPAIANRLGMNFSANRGRVLENIVFLELLRQGHEIYFHAGKHECDFLVKEGIRITRAIQVTWELHAENRERELGGLAEAMQVHQLDHGLLITPDEEAELDHHGSHIMMVPCWKWLLKGEA